MIQKDTNETREGQTNEAGMNGMVRVGFTLQVGAQTQSVVVTSTAGSGREGIDQRIFRPGLRVSF